MKKLFLLFIGLFIFSFGEAQLTIIQNGDVGKGTDNPLGDIHIADEGNVARLALERTDAGNFINLQSGTTGNAFYFKNNKRFAIVPSSVLTGVNPDIPNSLFFYGTDWSVSANAGNMGVGVDAPNEKITVNGNVRADDFLSPSDKRLKNNVSEFKLGLDQVLKLNPIRFTYNGKGGTKSGSNHVGVFAQELRKVAPELVENYIHTLYEYDEEGTQTKVGEEEYLQIKSSSVKYMLINAIKDQQALIEKQSKTIERLEEKVNNIVQNIPGGINITEITLDYSELAVLGQNIPNPFSNATDINYSIPASANSAYINIFDMNGRLMRKVPVNHIGLGTLKINAIDLPSGAFTYQLFVDGVLIESKKMIATK